MTIAFWVVPPRIPMVFSRQIAQLEVIQQSYGPVEKWEGSDKNLRNWPKIKWPIYIINH